MDAIEIKASDINISASGSKTMTDTNKAMKDPTHATYQKMVVFTTLKKADARRSIGRHISHLTRTQNAADRAVTTAADMPCPATIKNMECCLEVYYTKANTMELTYEHLLIVDQEDADRW